MVGTFQFTSGVEDKFNKIIMLLGLIERLLRRHTKGWFKCWHALSYPLDLRREEISKAIYSQEISPGVDMTKRIWRL